MFGRWPQVPGDRRWTVALLVLWLLLATYIVWTGDPIGYVILVLVGVFALLPALILYVGARRSRAESVPTREEPDDIRERES